MKQIVLVICFFVFILGCTESEIKKPQDLKVIAASDRMIEIGWRDLSDNEDGFKIERSKDGEGVEKIYETAGNIQSFRDEDVLEDSLYLYRLRAFNSDDHSGYSNTVEVRASPKENNPLEPPAAPSAFFIEAVTHDQVRMSWEDHSQNEKGFKVAVSTDGVTYSEVGVLERNEISFEHHGLTENTRYYYRICAYNEAGESSYAEEDVLTPLIPILAPETPTDLNAPVVEVTGIRLQWRDQADNEEGLRIERSLDAAFVDAMVIELSEPNLLYYEDRDTIQTETLYFYRVAAFNVAGLSDFSNEISVLTPGVIENIEAPTLLISDEITQTSAQLIWQDNADNEGGFVIERSGDGRTFDEIERVNADVTTFLNSGLSANSTWHYRVRAFLNDQFSAFSNDISITTKTPQPSPTTPHAPTALLAEAVSTSQINLTWTDNASDESGFRLERALAGDFQNAVTISINSNVTAYSDSGLSADTEYTYRILSFNSVGDSDYSNTPPSAITLPEPTQPPNPGTKFIADYTVAKESVLRRIPKSAIEQAKAKLHIMYSGTSHSRQVMQGMRGLKEYKPGDDTLFNFTHRGGPVAGALDIDYNFDGKTAWDLSQDGTDANGHTGYFKDTVRYLDSHPSANVVMWSWCSIEGHDVEVYLKNFGELVNMYKAGGTKGRVETNKVTLIFMTGYARGNDGDTPESPYIKSPYQNHKRIIDFCKKNGYFCLDYWSQDTYNYADDSYKPGESGNVNRQHHAFVTNPNNKLGEDWFECRNYINGNVQYPEHTADNANFAQHLTGNRRAYAAWWLFARIAGWDGALE